MKLFTVTGAWLAKRSITMVPMLVRMVAVYWAVTSMVTGGTWEYWGMLTPRTSTKRLTGAPPDAGVAPAGEVWAGGGVGVDTGEGVSKTQAAKSSAAANTANRNMNFISERIT